MIEDTGNNKFNKIIIVKCLHDHEYIFHQTWPVFSFLDKFYIYSAALINT